MSKQSVCSITTFSLARRIDLFLALEAAIASRSWAFGIVAFVNLCIRIAELDGNVSLKLVLESDSLDTGDSLDDGGLAVSDMTYRTYIDGGLSGDDFR